MYVYSVCMYVCMYVYVYIHGCILCSRVVTKVLIIFTQGMPGDKGAMGDPGMNASTEGECSMQDI